MLNEPELPSILPSSRQTIDKGSRSIQRRAAQVALVAVIVAGVVWGITRKGQSPENDAKGAACITNDKRQNALKAAAIGDVAGFSVNPSAQPMGNFSFLSPKGEPKKFSDFGGKIVLVNLWATWCAPCRKEMPEFDALQKSRGSARFEVVAINVDTRDPDKAGTFLDEIAVTTLARYADPKGLILQDMKKVGRAPGLPSTILLDERGCELGFLLGPAAWASKDALALVDAALIGSSSP